MACAGTWKRCGGHRPDKCFFWLARDRAEAGAEVQNPLGTPVARQAPPELHVAARFLLLLVEGEDLCVVLPDLRSRLVARHVACIFHSHATVAVRDRHGARRAEQEDRAADPRDVGRVACGVFSRQFVQVT